MRKKNLLKIFILSFSLIYLFSCEISSPIDENNPNNPSNPNGSINDYIFYEDFEDGYDGWDIDYLEIDENSGAKGTEQSLFTNDDSAWQTYVFDKGIRPDYYCFSIFTSMLKPGNYDYIYILFNIFDTNDSSYYLFNLLSIDYSDDGSENSLEFYFYNNTISLTEEMVNSWPDKWHLIELMKDEETESFTFYLDGNKLADNLIFEYEVERIPDNLNAIEFEFFNNKSKYPNLDFRIDEIGIKGKY